MEMIFDLRYRRLLTLPWERSVRGCVLLIFFGVLYFCVKACPTLDEVRRGRIAVDDMNMIFGIDLKDICDNKGVCAFIGFQDQGASLVMTNSKEIKKSAIKAAEISLPKIGMDKSRAEEKPELMNSGCNEDISVDKNIDRTLDMIMVGNNVPEIVNMTKIPDNNVETNETDMTKSGILETIIIGNSVPGTVTVPESSIDNVEIKEPDIEIKEPDIGIKETDIGIKEPEVMKEKEDNAPVIGEDESARNDFEGGKVIEGFSVDGKGYISGVTDDLALLDEILVIAADQECIGIREGAFADIEGIVTEIYIPANIRDIEPGAFRYFQDLIYIEVSEENPCYYSADGILYSNSGEEIMYPTGR